MEDNRTQIKEILKLSGTHRAPADMAQRVLSKWKSEQMPLTEIPPLISGRTWLLLVVTVGGLVTWLSMNYAVSSAQTPLGGFIEKVDLSFITSHLSTSPTLIVSMAAFAFMIGMNALIHRKGVFVRSTPFS